MNLQKYILVQILSEKFISLLLDLVRFNECEKAFESFYPFNIIQKFTIILIYGIYSS